MFKFVAFFCYQTHGGNFVTS